MDVSEPTKPRTRALAYTVSSPTSSTTLTVVVCDGLNQMYAIRGSKFMGSFKDGKLVLAGALPEEYMPPVKKLKLYGIEAFYADPPTPEETSLLESLVAKLKAFFDEVAS